MVKVKNANGDFRRGKQGTAVYQGFYGQQIRRKRETNKDCGSRKQLEVQERFKEGLAFAESLSDTEKQTIINYIKVNGLKLTWHNYAKLISMAPVKVDRSNLNISGFITFPVSMQEWGYRNMISVAEDSVIPKTNFPVLIDIQGTNPLGMHYINFSLVKPGGDDLRFTKSDGITNLTYGIEKWDDVSPPLRCG